MKKITTLILILIPFIKINAQCAQTSNIYTFTYNGHTYEVVKELKNWTDAAACAVERGGYLISIESDAEKNYVMSQLMLGSAANISENYHPVTDGGEASYIWTGGTDKSTEGTWIWDGDNNNTGTNFYQGQGTAGTGGGVVIGGAYVNWGCSSLCEPDNFYYINDQDALGLSLGSWPYGVAGQWNDIDFTNSLFFIIEKDGANIHEDSDKTNNIELYPNPGNNFIQINGVDDLQTQIKITDVVGKIYQESLYSDLACGKINISDLPKGMYFLIFENGGKTITEKFIKQ